MSLQNESNTHLMLVCQVILKRVTSVPERRNSPSTIDFRELEVDNDDKNFVFLDEVGPAVVIRLSKGCNRQGESAYLSVTAVQSRNILKVEAMNKYGSIYHKIHQRDLNEEDFKFSIKISTPIFVIYNSRIHHYLELNDDEEIASYRIKYLTRYFPFFNLIENAFSV
ncbi:hypothetical protein CWI38_0610p0020 [Hamiltosporidium tvaerminnensis]|uniref:Uncharacterized protein n=1 Tax=Hamiltosporidium tvaerminnensis TaxID=1176355 RepID=A0A4Q9LYI9_9MICR|nr:hypothetical protein CWI38_0610p0020 [Hamiltosporidium tvaerminnensis]